MILLLQIEAATGASCETVQERELKYGTWETVKAVPNQSTGTWG
jgi:hypothetical protein